MSNLRQVALGILAGLLSSAIILGSLFLAMAESNRELSFVSTTAATKTIIISLQAPSTPTGTARTVAGLTTSESTQRAISSPSPIPTQAPATPTLLASQTPTSAETATVCSPFLEWPVITVKDSDTLASLAQTYNILPEVLSAANCLTGEGLVPGSLLHVPEIPANMAPSPTQPTVPAVECGPPRGWVTYTVQSGDSLYRLSRELGVTVPQLQKANCLGNSILIRAGQKLYVPFLPVRTAVPSVTPPPTAIPTNAPLPTNPPTNTASPLPPTGTFTPVPTSTPVSTPTHAPGDIGTPTTSPGNIP